MSSPSSIFLFDDFPTSLVAIAHNRSVYASPPVGGSGGEKPHKGRKPDCGFSPPHFCGYWKPTVSFIATAKTSHTAGRLGDIF